VPLSRRLAIGLAALATLLGLGFAHAAQGSSPAAADSITVAPGDTLWDLAAQRYPNDDVRQRVQEIERLNGLRDPVIHPGERLRVPST
jgi:LysM repeat protein